ncbi:MAG: helix-turn-helix transcriptional regulator [Blastochloris sp.]|nr:helix-turn-helix transcriptional regulator [Blastochloris sp.]
MSEKPLMRRTPRQARGHRRVNEILTSTAELISETGYESLTTSAIADRASTSVGSLLSVPSQTKTQLFLHWHSVTSKNFDRWMNRHFRAMPFTFRCRCSSSVWSIWSPTSPLRILGST